MANLSLVAMAAGAVSLQEGGRLAPSADQIKANQVSEVIEQVNRLLDMAHERGLCVSIERKSVPPLAMGRHVANVSIWPAR